jgi:hypothetical protein
MTRGIPLRHSRAFLKEQENDNCEIETTKIKQSGARHYFGYNHSCHSDFIYASLALALCFFRFSARLLTDYGLSKNPVSYNSIEIWLCDYLSD